MALMQCDFYSETLGVSVSMNVILPQRTTTQIGMASASSGEARHPVLYLLHGLSDDHTIWLRRTSIERYVASLGIAVVMPAVGRSFYANMKQGYNYWDFISEELPALARSFFPISDKREDNFAAGLSMGGYGAFKLALSHPDRFTAAASLSGALDARFFIEQNKEEASRIFGSASDFNGSGNDLFELAKQRAAEGNDRLPLLYQCCGTEDFLYDDNARFRDEALELGLPLTYEEGPGEHEWGYWDRQIQRVLNWLPLTKKES
ncbi:alpha/beta hydrolase [Paenibacillus methanolicus]|uniref:S-formylglutathione hydrolase FrmB n=1 Tax=Paenibacillus methanolicus TaxID=582686 RepID=A0A5S5CKN7_9BACL|nr:alpha/beta hydrolase family protein [Paenibacillus methanolicus]TYP79447.1 S-formylglutathione hydrolase FrmB [Paenibacillus methanolicus]